MMIVFQEFPVVMQFEGIFFGHFLVSNDTWRSVWMCYRLRYWNASQGDFSIDSQ